LEESISGRDVITQPRIAERRKWNEEDAEQRGPDQGSSLLDKTAPGGKGESRQSLSQMKELKELKLPVGNKA